MVGWLVKSGCPGIMGLFVFWEQKFRLMSRLFLSLSVIRGNPFQCPTVAGSAGLSGELFCMFPAETDAE